MTATATTDLMTPAEFAERLGVKEQWVRDHIKEIPHRRLGRFLKFSEADLAAFIANAAEDEPEIKRTPRSETNVGRRGAR